MNKAQQLIKKISNHYKNNGFDFVNLANKIKDNKIDDNVKMDFSHQGYDCPENDIFPIVFHYSDKSKIIMTNYDIIAVEKSIHQ